MSVLEVLGAIATFLALPMSGVAIWQARKARREASALGGPELRILRIACGQAGGVKVLIVNGGNNRATDVRVRFSADSVARTHVFLKDPGHISDEEPLPILGPGETHEFVSGVGAQTFMDLHASPEWRVVLEWEDPLGNARESRLNPAVFWETD